MNLSGRLFTICLFFVLAACFYSKDTYIKKTNKAIDEENYQKAIFVAKTATFQYPKNPAMEKNYYRTMERIKERADLYFNTARYEQAGETYHLICKNFPPKDGNLSFTRASLKTRITVCSKLLYEKGLMEYRHGNIDAAITIWKAILVFDPDNPEVKNAVKTASRQRDNLDKIK